MNRSVSYTSLGLAMGTFPKHTNVPDAIINAVCYFDNVVPPPSIDALTVHIVEPLLKYDRLSQILDIASGKFRPPIRPYQPKDLIRIVPIDARTVDDMNQIIFRHLQDPLKHRSPQQQELPWWELLIFQQSHETTTTTKGQPSALVIRVHHALADGLALVHAFEKLLTNATNGLPIQLLATKKVSMSTSRTSSSSRDQPGLLRTTWLLLEATWHVLTLGMTKYDDDTAFSRGNHAKMTYSGQRKIQVFPTVPLDFIKALKVAATCTVNDIITTAVSQAIHDYCENQNDPVLTTTKNGKNVVQCRALLPVGFPRSSEELANPSTALRNKWCVVSCDLALGCTNIVDRLIAICKHTTLIRTKPRALMQLVVQNNIAPLLPKSMGRQVVMDVFSRHSCVLTNVPGPDVSCAIAGQPISAVQMFFPSLLTQISILSYNGQIYGNIVYDPHALDLSAMKDFGKHYVRALLQLAHHFHVDTPSCLDEYQ